MKRNHFFRSITERAGLPMEVFPGVPLLELCGDDRILLENHICVLKYSEQEILIRVSYGVIRICGKDLYISCVQQNRMIIHGAPESIALLKGV